MTKIDVAGCFLVCLVAYSWACSNTAAAAEAEKPKSSGGTPKASASTAKTTANPSSGNTDKDKSAKAVNPSHLPEVSDSIPIEKEKPLKPGAQEQSRSTARAEKGNASARPATVDKVPAVMASTRPITADKSKAPAASATLAKPATADKSKSTGADATKSKEQAKPAKAEKVEPRKAAHHSSGAGMLVPPPPPDTPTILAVPGGMFQSFVPTEMSPASLAERKKELVAQLASAEKLLDVKTQHSTDSKSRAEQFKSLFSEGVISKRELDNAQTEAESSVTEVNDAKLKVTSLQNMIARVDERLKPKPSVKAAKAQKSKKIAQTRQSKKTVSAGNDKKGGG